MGKQAMGTIARNQMARMDTVLFLLLYPQKPLVRTRVLDLINFDSLPAGQNAIIAVMSFSGYDIEDALVVNKASLDRGYGRCLVTRKHVAYVRKYANGTCDRLKGPSDPPFAQPKPSAAAAAGADGAAPSAGADKAAADASNPPSGSTITERIKAKMRAIDDDGLPRSGETVDPDSFLVNRETPLNTTDPVPGAGTSVLPDVHYRPSAVVFRSPEKGVVDRVLVTSTAQDHTIVKVLMRSVRRPELGDKFSSRHGQKGVVGLIAEQADMPFNDAGVCPDMIMNPHGFPSRMTVGKRIELLGGKAGVLDGRRRYGTAFGGDPVQSISSTLVANGYHYGGKETLTSGIDGEPMRSYVFFGPVYYQKLKHMVMDKMHARSR